jgi:hypothetical protein
MIFNNKKIENHFSFLSKNTFYKTTMDNQSGKKSTKPPGKTKIVYITQVNLVKVFAEQNKPKN